MSVRISNWPIDLIFPKFQVLIQINNYTYGNRENKGKLLKNTLLIAMCMFESLIQNISCSYYIKGSNYYA